MNDCPITGIILAAGCSERMGRFKPLLEIGGVPAVLRCVNLFREAGVNDMVAVTGHKREILEPVLHEAGVRTVFNGQYGEGMFTSVRAGLAAVDSTARGVLVLPADIPLVRPWTVKRLMEEFRKQDGRIIYPVFKTKRGHPPLIDRALIKDILEWNGDDGLRGALASLEEDAVNLPVADRNILVDMDTTGDYEEIERRWRRKAIPSDEECEEILTGIFGVPGRVISHSRAVARVARFIASELNGRGHSLDMDLLNAAALLHDIARNEPDHAAAGGRIVRVMGFPDVAAVIESHMDIEVYPENPIGPAEVLYLADKMTSEDRVVYLEERFCESWRKHGGNRGAVRRIEERYKNALFIKDKIDRETGTGLLENRLLN